MNRNRYIRGGRSSTSISITGAFPIVQSVNTGTDFNSAGLTSGTVQLPALLPGDLLLIFSALGGSVTNFAATGWTTLTGGGVASRIPSAFRIADGSEGASVSVTWTTGVNNGRFVSWRIPLGTWNGATAPEAAAPVTNAGSTTPDSPSLSPSWGAANTLWISFIGTGIAANTITGFPSNMPDNNTSRVDGDVANAHLGLASLALNAASVDPNNFTIQASTAWHATTIAVRGR